MNFLRNTWYLAAYSPEIGRSLRSRKIAGEQILMFRREDGAVAALSNICPHRFAPLDRGTLSGDKVQCLYHGLEFGANGKCTLNPHSDRITPNISLRTYPAIERDGMVWVWRGVQPPNPDMIPDMSDFVDREGVHTSRSYLFANYRYDILIDNLLDLSHADYLHKGSFSGGAGEKTDLEVFRDGDAVLVQRTQWRAPPPPFLKLNAERVDARILIRWSPSQAIKFYSDVVPTGEPLKERAELTDALFYHVATPADETHTHYFLGVKRFGPVDAEADRALQQTQVGVIEREDGPMLEAVDRTMAGRDLMDMKPVVLPTDTGAIRVRLVMKRLLKAEADAAVQTRVEATAEE